MIVRPIIHTKRPSEWKAFALACGAVPITDGDTWSVYGLAEGRLGIHLAAEGDAGITRLGIETSDLDSVTADHTAPFQAAHGPALKAAGPDLPEFLIDTKEGKSARGGQLVAAPLLKTTEVKANIEVLTSLGLTLRVQSNSGTYTDFAADGVVALHNREISEPDRGPWVELSFEHPNLDALASLLESAGFKSVIVDEAYGRSLHVKVGDEQAWVNETQTDLYGYTAG